LKDIEIEAKIIDILRKAKKASHGSNTVLQRNLTNELQSTMMGYFTNTETD